MPSPPDSHTSWIEILLGGGVLGGLVIKAWDGIRSYFAARRAGDASVKVREIESTDHRWEELYEEVKSLRESERSNMQTAIRQERSIGELTANYERVNAENIRINGEMERMKAQHEHDRQEWQERQERIEAVIKKFELLVSPDAVGGTLDELLGAVRSLVVELREAKGIDPYPRSTVIGNRERHLGDG